MVSAPECCIWRTNAARNRQFAMVTFFRAVDTAGRLIVANPGLGYAWVLNHRAEPVLVLRSPAGCGASLTNVAFGGAHGRTLYCTESASGCVLRAELDVPGLALSLAQPAAVAAQPAG